MRGIAVSTALVLLAASKMAVAGPIPNLLEGFQDKCNPYDTTCRETGPFLHHLADSAQTFDRLTKQDGILTDPVPGVLPDSFPLRDYGRPTQWQDAYAQSTPPSSEDGYLDDDDFDEEPASKSSSREYSTRGPGGDTLDAGKLLESRASARGPSPVPSMDFESDPRDDDFDDFQSADADNSTSTHIIDVNLTESNGSLSIPDTPSFEDATNSSSSSDLNSTSPAPLSNGTTAGQSSKGVQKGGALADHEVILDHLCLMLMASAGAIFLL